MKIKYLGKKFNKRFITFLKTLCAVFISDKELLSKTYEECMSSQPNEDKKERFRNISQVYSNG